MYCRIVYKVPSIFRLYYKSLNTYAEVYMKLLTIQLKRLYSIIYM